MTDNKNKTFIQVKINGKLKRYEMAETEHISIEEADRRVMQTDQEVES